MAIPIASGGVRQVLHARLRLAASTGDTDPVCVGDNAVDVTLKLSNKAKTQTLGSADITLPGSSSRRSAPATASKGTVSRATRCQLRNLNLPAKTGFGDLHRHGERHRRRRRSQTIAAIVKQSNEFNDSGGDANLFTLLPGAKLPTLTVEDCYGTIEGTVWQDTNERRDAGRLGPIEPGQGVQGLPVREGRSSYDLVQDVGQHNGTTGAYKFEKVRLNREYLVCERDPAGSTWSQTDADRAPHDAVRDVGNEPNGYAPQLHRQRHGQELRQRAGGEPSSVSTSVPGNVPQRDRHLRVRGEAVRPDRRDRLQDRRARDVHLPGRRRRASPRSTRPGSTTGTEYPVVERIKWTGLGTSQNPITLDYDDIYPYDGADKRARC